MKLTAEVFHPITGQRIEIEASSIEGLARANAHMGAMGYTPVLLQPAGGFGMPLAAEVAFNWASIGAYKYITRDGEEAVMWRGSSYKRRQLEAVENKKMTLQEAVKYSRGGRDSDPAHLVEAGDGEFKYVSLAMFRGNGRVDAATQLSPAELAAQNEKLEAQRLKVKK